ncbi:fimbrial biogenesis chaperone [Citrobacter freundii]|uniref:fimbrial biogenesis chaperone n=1 Tax=Citrobacter freundii TaxID=546 RepID=UPI0033396BF3
MLAFGLHAAVNISTTRVIFNHGETQRSVMLVNDGNYPVVVQSWVDDGTPEKGPSQANSTEKSEGAKTEQVHGVRSLIQFKFNLT